MENVSVHLVKESHEFLQIQHFFETSGNDTNLSYNVLNYEYFHNPDSYGYFTYALSENAVIGVTGNIAFDLITNGVIVNTLMFDRALVDMPFRGKNVFDKIMSKNLIPIQKLSENGFFWGLTPVPKAFIKFGYKAYNSVKRYSFEINKNINFRTSNKNYTVCSGYNPQINKYIYQQSFDHPDDFLIKYNNKKCEWLVDNNSYCKRHLFCFYNFDRIIGFCIIREASAQTLVLDDFHLNSLDNTPLFLQLIIQKFIPYGFRKISFIANIANSHLQNITNIFIKIGFAEEEYNAWLVLKPFRDSEIYPSQLQLTRIWAPPQWLPPSPPKQNTTKN